MLKSEKREDASSLILSGDPERLKAIIGELDKADDEWDNLTDDQLIASIIALAKRYDASPVEFGDVDGDDISAAYVVLAIRRIPKPKAYPRLITKEAKPIWDMLTVEHKDVLNKYKSDKKLMWAAAIIILKRYAAEKGIKPFTRDPGAQKVRKTAIVHINKRANNGNHDALDLIQDLFTRLKAAKLVKGRVSAEKFYEAVKHRQRYYITTVQTMTLTQRADPDFVIRTVSQMDQFGGHPPKYAMAQTNEVTYLYVQPGGKGDTNLYCYIATYLTRDQVILLFDLDDDAKDAEILKLSAKAGRRWVKTGELGEIPK